MCARCAQPSVLSNTICNEIITDAHASARSTRKMKEKWKRSLTWNEKETTASGTENERPETATVRYVWRSMSACLRSDLKWVEAKRVEATENTRTLCLFRSFAHDERSVIRTRRSWHVCARMLLRCDWWEVISWLVPFNFQLEEKSFDLLTFEKLQSAACCIRMGTGAAIVIVRWFLIAEIGIRRIYATASTSAVSICRRCCVRSRFIACTHRTITIANRIG